jgi:putative oxidoreductase
MSMKIGLPGLAAPLGDAASLVARLLVAYLFVLEGWGKIGGYADTQSYMAQFGVEPRLLPLVIALELGGGLALAFGAATRPAALALGIFSLLAALIFHQGADYSEVIEFRKDFAIAGGLFALAALGAGAWSLDALVARRLTPAPARGRADAVPR